MERMPNSVSPRDGGNGTYATGMKTTLCSTVPMELARPVKVRARAVDASMRILKEQGLENHSTSPFDYYPLDQAMDTTVILDLDQALDL